MKSNKKTTARVGRYGKVVIPAKRPYYGGGRPKGSGGRPKGSPNKITRDLKEAIMNAFNALGGERYLKVLARRNPQVFGTLLGKVLPMTINGSFDVTTHEAALKELDS